LGISGEQVIDTVLERLEESLLTPVFWSRSEILGYCNEGLFELNNISGKLHTEDSVVVSVDNFYNTPDETVTVMHASINGKSLVRTSLEALDRRDSKWESTTGLPKRWVPIGVNLFAIHPRPASGTESVEFSVLKVPTLITDDATAVDLDDEFIDVIEDYGFHIARFKEGGPEFANSMSALEDFAKRVGDLATKVLTQQPQIHAAEPNVDTGPSDTTIDRA
jgi:hypothetical protein